MRGRAALAGLLLLGAAAGGAVPDPQRRLVEAKRAAAVASARAAALSLAASGERRAAERAAADRAVLAARVDAAAADLRAAEARVALVQALLSRQRERLAVGQAPAARLLGGLAMMGRRPAIATLAQPGSMDDLVHVRAVLAGTLPIVRARTEALRADLRRARALEAGAATATAALRDGRANLQDQRTRLARAEAGHSARAATFGRSALGEQDRALALGERARDLVDRMGEDDRATDAAADLATLPGPLPRPQAPSATGSGVMPAYRLPVAGRLVTGLGEVSAAGVRSRGLTLAVAPGARVVAPAAGTVRYAGRFRGYGVIVLLDHGAGWSSLVTGLVASPVRAGDRVGVGAPIGVAGGGEEPHVTVELRRRGEPMDAAALIG